MERLLSLLGLLVFLGIAWALSTNRKAIKLRTILWGLGLQFTLALFVLKVPIGPGPLLLGRREDQRAA